MKAPVFSAEVVFVRILSAWIAGMLIAASGIKLAVAGEIALLMVCFSAIGTACFLKLHFNRHKLLPGLVCMVTAIFGGFWAFQTADERVARNHFSRLRADFLEVMIADDPRTTGKLITATGAVESVVSKDQKDFATGHIQLNILKPAGNLSYGDLILIKGDFTETKPPLNPAQFHYKKWLATKNIYHTTLISPGHFKKLDSAGGNLLKRYALLMRRNCAEILAESIADTGARAVAATLLLGLRTELSSDVLDAYAQTGTIHALSVSGMHMALVYLVLQQILKQIRKKWFSRWLKPVISAMIIWMYALLTGFSPSVLRAAVMISVFIIAEASGRNTNAYNTLAFSAFLLLNIEPFLLNDAGFQLSFLSVLGLLAFQHPIYKIMPFNNYIADQTWRLCATSLSAQISTYPLSIYYFHQFPTFFLPANLFLTLPVSLVMYLGMALLVFRLTFLGPVIEFLIILMNGGLKWMAQLPGAIVDQIWLSFFQTGILVLAITLFTAAAYSRKGAWLIAALAAWLSLETQLAFKNISISKRQLIIFYSIRNHYATAFISGRRATIFTDLDTESKIYRNNIKPSLDSLQVRDVSIKTTQSSPGSTRALRFRNKQILLFHQTMTHLNAPAASILWLNAIKTQKNLERLNTFKGIIIADGTCSYSVTSSLSEMINTKNIKFISLRQEPALVIDISKEPEENYRR
ncbi:ComEC/Rec2 family competence protein [Pedobacter sp. SYP-B3415]|uniref:ComEC/Rec2 family competence protein n=1 Tax=Pedobacter sp. SYP-B3415 TaxID=2496641 RepID=UPI00101C1382|nr:ComEC/Rec2 family competence protein [Pedobacter sp. SYP-B3415]